MLADSSGAKCFVLLEVIGLVESGIRAERRSSSRTISIYKRSLYIKDATGRNPKYRTAHNRPNRQSGGGHPPSPTTPGSVHGDSSWLLQTPSIDVGSPSDLK